MNAQRSSQHVARVSAACRCLASACCLAAFAVAAAEGEWPVPQALQPWKDAGYTKRFYLEVRPPAAAGAGTLAEPDTASVLLPLKFGATPGSKGAERVLLIGEDGAECAVQVRPAGTEAEVVFNTRSGLRRFCLYEATCRRSRSQT
ncbi:MAG: hypothetical protein NTW87_32525 [Planctomycetota bacterium]|nr:hypothetical protein [Planctomycetota bacterium]